MSRTFGECADGQMTHDGAWHARQLGDRIQIHPGHVARAFFFSGGIVVAAALRVGEWPGRAFPYVIFSLCAWGSLWHGASVGTRMRRRQDRCVCDGLALPLSPVVDVRPRG